MDEKITITQIHKNIRIKPSVLGKYQITPEAEKDNYIFEVIQEIQSLTDSGEMCGGVNEEYIEESVIREADVLITVTKDFVAENLLLTELLGFATITKEGSALILDLICSKKGTKGVGSILLDIIEEIGNYNGLRYVKLSSLTGPFGFYVKKDYRCDPPCIFKKQAGTNEGVELIKQGFECNSCEMKKRLRGGGGKKRKTMKKKRSSRMAKT